MNIAFDLFGDKYTMEQIGLIPYKDLLELIDYESEEMKNNPVRQEKKALAGMMGG